MNVRANKHLLLWSSAATMILLGTAAVQEHMLKEWRGLQQQYRRQLPGNAGEFNVQLRQIVVPALGAADRCVSCHVGMAAGESGIEGSPVFTRHPNVVHEPSEFGCTVCHGGQGRATERHAAHGDVDHWPEPMIPKRYAYAACGTCHTHLQVPSTTILERGLALIERQDCLACHRLDGRGGTLRPGGAGGMEGNDLSRIGATGYDRQWYEKHLDRAESGDPLWAMSIGSMEAGDQRAIDALLASRVGAPELIESKALFHSRGCRGCHQVSGVGGDDGPSLTHVGQRDPGQLDFSRVREPHTVASWLEAHFRAPALIVPGSQMPELGLDDRTIEQLTFYMMSLRQSALPEAYWPADRLRAERFGEREFATDGATLYGTFCAACHGARGEGMRYAGLQSFPAIANADFLTLANDAFIRATIENGRRGRRMPAWGKSAGGLRGVEIDSVINHVRRLGGGVQAESDAQPPRWARDAQSFGSGLYSAHCAACHGGQGEGGEGPALGDPILLANASDTYFFETIRRGRRGTSMQGFATGSVVRTTLSPQEIEAIVAHIRTWEANHDSNANP